MEFVLSRSHSLRGCYYPDEFGRVLCFLLMYICHGLAGYSYLNMVTIICIECVLFITGSMNNAALATH